jgi:dTDP-4-dehydrorhamnose 3,5-epimerase
MHADKKVRPHLIGDVWLAPLKSHPDSRGSFTELFRPEWQDGFHSLQWNVVRSVGHIMRGMHVHVRHADYVVVLEGTALIGLRDLRKGSPAENVADVVAVQGGTNMTGIWIPPGVLHGFYFPDVATHIYQMTKYWTPHEEMGCAWHDPAMELDWQIPADPALSDRDQTLGTLDELLAQMEPFQHTFLADAKHG